MRKLTTALCLTVALLLGSTKMSWSDNKAHSVNTESLSKILKKLDEIEKRVSKIEKTNSPEINVQRLIDLFSEQISNKREGENAPKKDKIKSSDLLEITNWSAYKAEPQEYSFQEYIFVSFTLKNISKKHIVLLDGATVFQDKLGKRIGRLKLPNDVDLTPGSTMVDEGKYSLTFSNSLNRLLSVNKALVDVKVDLNQIMFADGSKLNLD